MPRLRCRPALVLLAAATVACEGESPNPFAEGIRSVPPSAAADIVFTSNAWASAGSAAPREVFAVEDSGANLTRLTFCSTVEACDIVEAVPSVDRTRVMVRRVVDTTGDRFVTGDDGAEIAFYDLERGLQATVVPAQNFVTGLDWDSALDLAVYSARGPAGTTSDLFRMDSNGQNNRNLTNSGDFDEVHPRLERQGRVASYEFIESGQRAIATIYASPVQQTLLTDATAGTERLAGSPAYLVGSDADPAFSPDSQSVVLRRLTAVGADPRGSWDIVIVPASGGGEDRVIASGPAFRGAPDWGADGIVFPESDPGSETMRLVIVQPDGSGRTVPVTVPATISHPRWLRPAS